MTAPEPGETVGVTMGFVDDQLEAILAAGVPGVAVVGGGIEAPAGVANVQTRESLTAGHRKLAASILVTAAVTGGVLGVLAGTAAAAGQPARASHERVSVDRKSTSRDRTEHRSRHDRARVDRVSRDR